MPNSNALSCWAVTAPGLEPFAERELRALGVVVGERESGGVAFVATPEQLADSLLWLRTANRVVMRLAAFSARTFGELERHATTIDWRSVVPTGAAVHFRVTSKKSKLYHQDAIAERLEKIVVNGVTGATSVRSAAEAELLEDDVLQLPHVQRILVRVFRDQVTISADAAGGLLHRRGWRQAVGKAPLRETLAAAMLLGAEWDGTTPLCDPMGGSGTIAIEAATILRNLAPGRLRRFAAESWPMMSPSLFDGARDRVQQAERGPSPLTIECFDRDDGAVRGAQANAGRARVSEDIQIERRTIAMLEPDQGDGLLITNPPYGVRVGERMPLRDLYAVLGKVHRERRPGWRLAILSADAMLTGHIGTAMKEVWRSENGGLPVREMIFCP